MSCGGRQWSSTFDPFALTGTVHRFPQIAAPLHIQPKIRAVAEHAGKDERGRSGHVATVVAQLVDVLALHPHRFGQCACVRPIGSMNSSLRISPTLAGLRFVINMAHLTDNYYFLFPSARPIPAVAFRTSEIVSAETSPAVLVRSARSAMGNRSQN